MTQLLKNTIYNGASVRLKQIGKSCYHVEVYRRKELQATFVAYDAKQAQEKYDHAVNYLNRLMHDVTDEAINYIRDKILKGISQ